MKKIINNCINVFTCFMLSQVAFSQVSQFSLGSLELKSSSKRTGLLEKAMIGKSSFHGRIGGISFEQTATPDNSVDGMVINLNYDPTIDTQNHLKVNIGRGENYIFNPDIPDWQLIPIAKYANDSNNAVFTLFGDQNDNWTEGVGQYRYHSAFDSNLLGLRMFQADLLFAGRGGSSLSELPSDISGKTLIADNELRLLSFKGEPESYYDLIDELKYNCPKYNSYILTDWGQEILFGISGNQFYITGEPYYLFTKSTYDNTKTLYKDVQIVSQLKDDYPFITDTIYASILKHLEKEKFNSESISDISSDLLSLSYKYGEPFKSWFYSLYQEFQYSIYEEENNLIIEKLKTEFLKLNEKAPFLNDSDFLFISRLSKKDLYSWSSDNISESLYRLSLTYPEPFKSWFLTAQLNQYEPSFSADFSIGNEKVDLLLCGSQSMQMLNQKIFEFNPVVFNSCIVTMRYAAFFRYVKKSNPLGWQKFMSQINAIKKIFPSDSPGNPVNKGIVPPNKIDSY